MQISCEGLTGSVVSVRKLWSDSKIQHTRSSTVGARM